MFGICTRLLHRRTLRADGSGTRHDEPPLFSLSYVYGRNYVLAFKGIFKKIIVHLKKKTDNKQMNI